MLDAAPKMLDAMDMEKITASGAADRSNFVDRGQFWGFSGSLGPIQVTNSKAGEGGVFVLVEGPFGIEVRLTARPSALCFSDIHCVVGSMLRIECEYTMSPEKNIKSLNPKSLTLQSAGSAIGQDLPLI
jgi:hypothetical protein